MMAGQLAPANLFDLRPDVRALIVLARLKRRNAETLFGEVANQLAKIGAQIQPETLVMFRLEVLLELLADLDLIDMDEFCLRFENDLAPGLDDAIRAAQQAARGLVLPS